jgi:hypothetical protein
MNTGQLGFDFEACTISLATCNNKETNVHTGSLIITPRAGHVRPNQEMIVVVKYCPGVCGAFEEKLQFIVSVHCA